MTFAPTDEATVLHTLGDLSLSVCEEAAAAGSGLSALLEDLSFARADAAPADAVPLALSIRLTDSVRPIPRGGRELFRDDALLAVDAGDDVYVSDGSSLLWAQAALGRAQVDLDVRFFRHPAIVRHRFWAFGLLTLLRRRGVYALHAAAIVTPAGTTVLLVGPSGSGKSTLALGLVRHGCRYVSDDALLVRAGHDGVDALAFRKPFSVDAERADCYPDVRLGPAWPSSSGRSKRRADVHASFPGQYIPRCRPDVIVFPRIVEAPRSVMRRLAPSAALGRLLGQSGPELFDRAAMRDHLDLLRRLSGQTRTYELDAGRELPSQPVTLLELLADVDGAEPWRASSSN